MRNKTFSSNPGDTFCCLINVQTMLTELVYGVSYQNDEYYQVTLLDQN